MGGAEILDLTGESCPMTLVYARLAVEALAPGMPLTVKLAEGEPPHQSRRRSEAKDTRWWRWNGKARPSRSLSGKRREMALDPDEILRYSRQLILPEFGAAGQEKLKKSRVLIIGAGGLGSPAALYLAAAGVGKLGICDDDAVEVTNLQRQIIHRTEDVGRPKTASAAEKLKALNPLIEVVEHRVRFAAATAAEILTGYDLAVDASDTFESKFFINDSCVGLGVPYVYGGVVDFEGQLMTVVPGNGPCYRCFFREPPPPGAVPTCSQAGIIGPVAGTIGALQALEAIKLLTKTGEPMTGRLLIFDGFSLSFREVAVRRNPECPACGAQRDGRPPALGGGGSGSRRACLSAADPSTKN